MLEMLVVFLFNSSLQDCFMKKKKDFSQYDSIILVDILQKYCHFKVFEIISESLHFELCTSSHYGRVWFKEDPKFTLKASDYVQGSPEKNDLKLHKP